MTLEDKLERAEALLTRLHSRLYRTVNAIRKVDAQRKRLAERIHAEPPGTRPTAKPEFRDRLDDIVPAITVPAALDIPPELRRAPNAADEAAKTAILAGQAEAKKARKAASKARNADQLAKQPLTGKAAIAAIRQTA